MHLGISCLVWELAGLQIHMAKGIMKHIYIVSLDVKKV